MLELYISLITHSIIIGNKFLVFLIKTLKGAQPRFIMEKIEIYATFDRKSDPLRGWIVALH